MDTNVLLKMANEEIENPDVLIDPFDLTFIWVCDKTCEKTGYGKNELDGKSMFTICPEYKPKTEMEVNMITDPAKERNIPIVTKEGKHIIFHVKSVPIKPQDYPVLAGKIMSISE